MVTIQTRRGKATVPLFSVSLLTLLLFCLFLLALAVWILGALLTLGALIAPLLLSLGWSAVQLFAGIFLGYRCLIWAWRVGSTWLTSHQQLRLALLAFRSACVWACRELLRLMLRLLFQ